MRLWTCFLTFCVVFLLTASPCKAHAHGETKDKSKWQEALIKVDAYPKVVLKGHVKFVDDVANTQSIWDPESLEKKFKTQITIDNDKNLVMPRLRPGMSAEVTIEDVDRKTGVVRVPAHAVVHTEQGNYCYVKVAAEILKREVTLGLSSDHFAEIKSGIQEGEVVLHDVAGLLPRLGMRE
jgi:multidrug efflux pump subunit AcrA (membrane-fusion protein)